MVSALAPPSIGLRPPPLVAGLYLGDLLVAALAVIGFLVAGAGGADFVAVGEESNLPTWYTSSQLLLVALGLGLLAARDIRRDSLRTWPLLLGPAFFLLLSLDEAAMLHERLGDWFMAETSAGEGLRTGPWMFVYAPLAALVFGAAVRAYWPYWRGRRLLVGLVLAGVVVYGASAVGLEFVANFVGEGSLAQKGLGFAEELGEMVGVTTLLWGVAVLLRWEGVRV
ncbi:MAG TPA: hypothetical protein VK002_12250 [Rubricoccaceae bacterium]|nr:hypothetical protein [Rubricoccaceae bacterium]